MSVGAEPSLIEEWVESICLTTPAITGLVGNRVYQELAPLSANYPFIVHQTQTSSDLYGVGARRIWVDAEVIVRGVAQVSSYTPLKPLASAIDAAFDGTASSLVDGSVIAVRRIRPYTSVEQYEGYQIRHLGGVYRVIAQGL
jgi:hypothetical protein